MVRACFGWLSDQRESDTAFEKLAFSRSYGYESEVLSNSNILSSEAVKTAEGPASLD